MGVSGPAQSRPWTTAGTGLDTAPRPAALPCTGLPAPGQVRRPPPRRPRRCSSETRSCCMSLCAGSAPPTHRATGPQLHGPQLHANGGGGHHLRMSNTPRRVVRPGEARSQLPVTQASTTEATSLASGSSLRQTADHMSSAMYVQISQPSCSATVPACSRLSCHPSYRVNGERVDAYARAFNVQRPPSPFPCAPHGDAPTSQRCNGQLRHCCGSIQPASTAP